MSLITLHMRYTSLSGVPYSGQVVIQPTSILQDLVGGATLGLDGVTVSLDGTGAGQVNLPYNDDPNISTSNPALKTWCYMITEQVIDPAGLYEPRPVYFIDLPMSLGSSATLANLARSSSRPGLGFFVPFV